jgi:secreted trypsin-like serine protease
METRGRPENLYQVSKPISDQEECGRIWNGQVRQITDRFFCTGIFDGRDSCDGDSGSAILRNGIQVGVVSFGSDFCGDGSAPAVYVRLEHPLIRNFITQHTGI